MTPQEIADACARAMHVEDATSRSLGIEISEVGPGSARLSMRVADKLTNGHGLCHGGYIFILADTALAYACNTYDQRAVASGASIEFVAPAQVGDTLVAQAVEQLRAGRRGVYDIRVTNQHGALIALFRGRSATIKGTLIDNEVEKK
ncbi:MAG: hydroxyphenylacetyl-CoA thioesterase PaaI [Burkholderiaceae bacterium]|nr:hydroxyphenylacetyl-CoA thioesterase PaaI [Burkholderiaceae bacterium]